MRRFCQGIASVVLVAAIAGCSDTGPQEGKVPFRGTSTDGFTSLTNQMKNTAKAQAKKALEEEEAKAKESKPAEEAKPAEAKPAEAKPAEAKPAEAKPAGKSG
jgi:hypothetical protein